MNSVTLRPCSVDDCDRPKGPTKYCHMHYWRLNTKGSLGSPDALREQHGLKGSSTYEIWVDMRQRCTNPRKAAYKHYGARGITVCKRWSRFTRFLDDMGERPPGKTLDRIDLNGHYSPDNCRWATPSGQAANRRQHPNATGYVGVFKSWNRYYGQVTWEGLTYCTPSTGTPEEAAWLRDQWAIALHGEYARLNFDYERIV